ncbi:protein F9 [BeAn 58058 virus]|uniref:protein F9 n=1 Tax=BeAn 58058 virus TaxID=67082 RepID=UPI00090A6D4F|nr:protein F9 [BeAn 58058 virus]APG58229.1 protein F9 [BeAn 58058 virus]
MNFMLLVRTFNDIVNMMPEKDKIELADEIGIDLNNSNDHNYISNLERKCTASADIENVIDIQKFNIGYCKAPEGKTIQLQVVNSGTAEANCAIQTIMKSMNKRYIPDNLINNKLKIPNITWIVLISSICLIIFIIGVCLLRRKINFRYRYGNYLYV